MSSTSSNGSFVRTVTILSFSNVQIFLGRSISQFCLASLSIRKFAPESFPFQFFTCFESKLRRGGYLKYDAFFFEDYLSAVLSHNNWSLPSCLSETELCTWSSSFNCKTLQTLQQSTALSSASDVSLWQNEMLWPPHSFHAWNALLGCFTWRNEIKQ